MCVYLNVFGDLFWSQAKDGNICVFLLKLLLICFHFNLILDKRIVTCIVT